MWGRSLFDFSAAGRTPQEAKIREEVRLTPMELDGPGSNWE